MAKSVSLVPGVISADLSFAGGVLMLEYDPAADPLDAVVSVFRSAGLGVEQVSAPGVASTSPALPTPTWWERHGHVASVVASGVLIAIGLALQEGGRPAFSGAATAANLAAVLAGGLFVGRRAWNSVRARSLDMNVLMSLAVIGAVLIAAFQEAAAIVFLFSLGQLLESRALDRTRRSIRDLMDLTPTVARVRRSGSDVKVGLDEAVVGDLLIVKPGERIALDGKVIRGASAVDEAAITGESVPAEKAPGSLVYAGTVNASGLLEVEVTSLAADSTLARIVYLVEEAQAQRAPTQRLVDRFTRWYTPAVVGLAVAIAVLPPAVGSLSAAGALPFDTSWSTWFYRALVMLVVACPCALVISTPVAIVSAITRATRDGVLVKGGAFLETAAGVRVVAFDKTGTLTCGRPEVTDVVPLGAEDSAEVLRIAATLEAGSTHPVAAAVLRAAATTGGVATLEQFEDLAGRGVRARIDGISYSIGSPSHAEGDGAVTDASSAGIVRLEDEGKSVLVLSREDVPLGLIAVADEIRPEARDIVAALRRGGVEHVVMLTGDNPRTSAAVASLAGVTEYRARLLPSDKVDAVREMQSRFGVVAMIGDGVNDAPALAAADIGIAMGAAGSDTALETADVALMAPELHELPRFLRLGRRTVANIKFNVGFSIVTKAIVLVMAFFGMASLWLAVFADMGVSLLVTLNGLRLLRPGEADG